MNAVFRKELRSSMFGMSGPLFIAVVICVIGAFTLINNFLGGAPHFEYALITGGFWSLVLVPILTMKSFSEERHTKTDQLLYSLPLTSAQVVMGKYFAMVFVFAIPCALFCVFPPVLATMYDGTMPYFTAYAGILTYFLMGCAVIAVCMFISTLSESQLITAIVSIVTLILLYIVGNYASSITGIMGKILSAVCIFRRIYDTAYGYFDITCLVYYASVAALFVFFTVQSFEKRRWS